MSSRDIQNFNVIRPDSRIKEGIFVATHHLLSEIWNFRIHIRIVFKEQFRAAYYGTGLGIFWNFVLPLVPLTVYWFLSKLRVFPNFEGVDSATFLTFGVTLWFLFAGCVQTPIQILQSRNKEAMKTSFPLSASVVSGFAKLLFDTLIRIALVVVIIIATHSWPKWQGFLLPFLLMPAFLMFISAGLFFGILNVIYNDVSRVVNIVLQYGIFVSGVIFPLYDIGFLSTLNNFNPFAIYIESCRSLVFQGTFSNLNNYLVMSLVSLVVFIISMRLFHVMEVRVREVN